MFFLIAFPVDMPVPKDFTSNLISQNKLHQTKEIKLPKISFKNFDSLILLSDEFEKIDKSCSDLILNFKNIIERICPEIKEDNNISNIIDNFFWNNKKYEYELISEIYKQIEIDLIEFRKNYTERYNEYEKEKKLYDKQNNLNILQEINFDEEDDLEFISRIYIFVKKEEKDKFDENIKQIDFICSEEIEKKAETENELLFLVLCLKSKKEIVKKDLIEKGYLIRGSKGVKKVACNYLLIKKEFIEFLKIRQFDLYSTFFHIKLMRLYVESAMRYGYPTNYLFFVSEIKGKGDKKCWNSVINKWSYSDRIKEDYLHTMYEDKIACLDIEDNIFE